MIHDIVVLEGGKDIFPGKGEPKLFCVHGAPERTVDQATRDLGFGHHPDTRMHVNRVLAVAGHHGEHGAAPWVASKQPVALRSHKIAVLQVTRHQFIKYDLGDERHDDIV